MKKDRKWIWTSVIALFVGAIGMYLVMYYLPMGSETSIINKLEKEVTVNDAGISDAVEKLYDAVVVVHTYKNKQEISSGSGFVYKKSNDKAYILTNNHVIESGTSVEVTFTNGKSYDVEVVGKEVYSDIAVLSIDAKNIIAVAEIGSSESTKLGDTVFTIGAPIGSVYSGTVTRGILSGKDRMVAVNLGNTMTNDYVMKVIQTDASINSGNSGGPLANSNGEVIGITSLKLVSSGVEGIGFAIPIEDALKNATLLESNGEIIRPYLGVSMAETSEALALQRYNIYVPSGSVGVVIVEVEDGSPADDAGLKMGDIITAVDDEKVTNVAELKYQLYLHTPGDTIQISYQRNTDNKLTKAKLEVSK